LRGIKKADSELREGLGDEKPMKKKRIIGYQSPKQKKKNEAKTTGMAKGHTRTEGLKK